MIRPIKTLVLAAITAYLLSGFVALPHLQNGRPDWLVGTWETKMARGNLYETWKKISNAEFSGKSYMIKDKDTLVFETIQLIERNNVLHYIPTVKGQNNDKPVIFPLKTNTATQLVFENLAHDFPQVVSYTRITADSLYAEVSGTSNGKTRKQRFGMKRVY
ncbi:MAG: DUF6265 family protein [Daejeonella sp.]|uniref:DUF6265 family protein n=1 Tax=Daejeonella sp. JGW-45 TaxID=3034148 RepID=UPI0023EC7ED0|nr:DUF6265 family protein [Daejeonella sp. JGW-45]